MPELLEAELYRRSLERVIGWQVVGVHGRDPLVVPDAELVAAALAGATIAQVRRHGKVVLVETTGTTVGVHFGMTGRVIVGDDDPIPQLAYGAGAVDDRFDRWVVHLTSPTAASTTVRLSDARRLARVVLDPDLSRLGPDATEVDEAVFAQRLRGRRAPIKAVLLDQQVVAGLGNLLADELLWRCGIAPQRPTDRLEPWEVTSMAKTLPVMVTELLARGGSHRGDLDVERRRPGATCPLDGAHLVRRSIGGRTSWSCPLHQR